MSKTALDHRPKKFVHGRNMWLADVEAFDTFVIVSLGAGVTDILLAFYYLVMQA